MLKIAISREIILKKRIILEKVMIKYKKNMLVP